jgi:type IV pilus assembly protein PilX
MVLLLITLLGITAANMGLMQERMAGNLRESNEAFQNAEATLREVEGRMAMIVAGGTGGVDPPPLWGAMSLNDNDCTLSSPKGWADWDDSAAPWRAAPTTGGPYIVIDLENYRDPATGLSRAVSCVPMNEEHPARAGSSYLIVARGSGANGTGDVILQSIYWTQ